MKVVLDSGASIPESGVAVETCGNAVNVMFDYAKETETDEEGNETEVVACQSVWVRGKSSRSYKSIVSAIVRDKYSDDDAFAIIANKGAVDDGVVTLSEGKSDEYEERYKEFQEWRAEAKIVAATAVSLLNA